MADMKMKFGENILEFIISEFIYEDIEKVGDAGKEDGREALGKVVDKIDIIVNVMCLENLRLNRDESIESFVHFSTETGSYPAPHRIHPTRTNVDIVEYYIILFSEVYTNSPKTNRIFTNINIE